MKNKNSLVLILFFAHNGFILNYMFGFKLYTVPQNVKETFTLWRQLRVDSILVGPQIWKQYDFSRKIRESGILVGAILPVFFDEELDRYPQNYAKQADGTKAHESWVRFWCPSKAERIEKLKLDIDYLAQNVNPDYLNLDFIRYFVFWEMVKTDADLNDLPQTCFDNTCIQNFLSENPEIQLSDKNPAAVILNRYEKQWTGFKCKQIETVLKYLGDYARNLMPDIQIIIHSLPWRLSDFSGAIQSVAGQDLSLLGPAADWVSPMCYAPMVGQKPSWINSIVSEHNRLASKPTVPAIQVSKCYDEPEVSAETFMENVKNALMQPSSGVLFYSWEYLVKSEEKLEALLRFRRIG